MAPEGQVTRPTADRTRQALFNVLDHAAWAPGLVGARVIDLFAGSGALGLEVLSRGGAQALFIDANAIATHAISRNVAALRLESRASVLQTDAARLGTPSAEPFDIAFLDPPYARGLCEPALECLARGGWLAPRALAVVERGVGEPEPKALGFEPVESRAWGVARVWFLRLVEAA